LRKDQLAEETFRIQMDGSQSVTAVRARPAGKPAGWTFMYAPGAGSNVYDPFGGKLSAAFTASGIEVIRFQFPYAEAKRRLPDRTPVLEATWTAAISQCRQANLKLAVGGRSMGGRIASQVVARGESVDALVLFAYPLHPPDQPGNLRTKHLPEIAVPTLFISGTRDEFGTPDELATAVAMVPGARLFRLEGANHGFGPVKGAGRTKDEIEVEALGAAMEFLR
jgi:predicted alpha/beta-hydrolase family hydrolase